MPRAQMGSQLMAASPTASQPSPAGGASRLELALQAFRHLTEYVQTHPEAILQGKEKK